MDLRISSINTFTRDEWNQIVDFIPACSYGHTWEFVNYLSLFQNVIANESFICFDDRRMPIAVCPFIVTENSAGKYNEISSNGSPVPIPVVSENYPLRRKKILNSIFKIYFDKALEHNIKVGSFISHPLTNQVNEFGTKYNFELENFLMIPNVVNTLVIDLEKNIEVLLKSLSKYQRKNIRKAEKEIKISVVDETNDNIDNWMETIQGIHYKSARKSTRPQSTWDSMKELVKTGKSNIFVGLYQSEVICYLYCGTYHRMAFGWSQSNVDKYEEKLNVRHLLEWEAILYYKSKGYKYYELGERHFGPQLFHSPTPKEISISDFKENYGGYLMTKIIWRNYFDIDFMKEDLNKFLNHYKEDYTIAKSNLIFSQLNSEDKN